MRQLFWDYVGLDIDIQYLAICIYCMAQLAYAMLITQTEIDYMFVVWVFI